jgi:hypothetical protein
MGHEKAFADDPPDVVDDPPDAEVVVGLDVDELEHAVSATGTPRARTASSSERERLEASMAPR